MVQFLCYPGAIADQGSLLLWGQDTLPSFDVTPEERVPFDSGALQGNHLPGAGYPAAALRLPSVAGSGSAGAICAPC